MAKVKEGTFGESKSGMSRPIRICDMNIEDMKKATKAKLDKEPKEFVMLERQSYEDKDAAEIITINHYPFVITKGRMVEVPKSVAWVVKQRNDGVDVDAVLKKYNITETKN